ncbi:hypothetical protein JXB41_03745 [Candidatus Woesearchaeota archaeon]|nr:hypothetical protein [Candidatus Woesearchaeota archaeon]
MQNSISQIEIMKKEQPEEDDITLPEDKIFGEEQDLDEINPVVQNPIVQDQVVQEPVVQKPAEPETTKHEVAAGEITESSPLAQKTTGKESIAEMQKSLHLSKNRAVEQEPFKPGLMEKPTVKPDIGQMNDIGKPAAASTASSSNVSVMEFIKTGVTGFDELIVSGIPKGSQVLISGGPGTAKTTFCLQTLAYGAKNNEKSLYLSFEEEKHRLLHYMRTYGWNPDELIKKGYLRIEKLDPFKISRSVETLLAQARGELLIETNQVKDLIPEDFKPDRIVLDSLSAVAAGFYGKIEGYRAYISQIFDTFRKIGATSFLISEIEHSTVKYSQSGVEEFLADAVFVFYNLPQGNERIHATEIIKVRGTQHKKRIVPFKIYSNKGINVYPMEELFVDKKE